MLSEQWKDAPGFEGLYQVSDHGRVRALVPRNSKHREFLTASIRPDGYRCVALYGTDGSRKGWLLHRLVLEAFSGAAPGLQGAHLNGDQSDNRLSNLAWVTSKVNHSHMREHGTAPIGERNGQAQLTEADVRSIRAEYVRRSRTHGCKALAAKYGTSLANIWLIVRRINWQHIN